MKIAVIGAGAMGSLFGALLSGSENEVWIVDPWQQQIDTINQKGLIVEETSGEINYRNLHATTDPQKVGVADMVLVFVKSMLTEPSVRDNKCLFSDRTIVITLQNGLGNPEKIAKFVSKENIIVGATAQGAILRGPGRINHAGHGNTVIGEMNATETDKLKIVTKAFTACGVNVETSRNVLGLIWDKLLVNIGVNALSAVTGLNTGALIDHPELEEIFTAAIEEAVTISKLKGIKLEHDPIENTRAVCRATVNNKTSMLQDILNKRKTEIDMINGAIVEEGKLLGVATPVNMVLTNLVRWKQK